MKKTYGIAYKGSKNSIAKEIIDFLPKAENFYDLFMGGGAITHCACLSNKYKNIYANDINKLITDTFRGAVEGKYKNETRWINKETFKEEKDKDGYIKYCWSFGNDGKSYLYNSTIEKWKECLWYARVLKDYSIAREMGIEGDLSRKDVIEHMQEYKEKYIKYLFKMNKENKIDNYIKNSKQMEKLQSLESLERLQSLESLERLQSLERLENLEITNLDYKAIEIKANSVIYCDIPYVNTHNEQYNKESINFDYKTFFEWAYKQKEPVFISSREIEDTRFKSIFQKAKRNLVNIFQNSTKYFIENIYVADYNYEKYKQIQLFN